MMIEQPKNEPPLVCDFLARGLAQPGDVLIDNSGNTDVYRAYDRHPFYPHVSDKETWSRAGWKYACSNGKRNKRHIIRIERDGVVVAEGQGYDY